MGNLIKKIKSLYGSGQNTSYEKKGINPKKDWVNILGVAFIILVLGGIFTVYFYLQINEGSFFKRSYEESSVTVLNKQALDSFIKTVNDKRNAVKNIEDGIVTISDPSR